MTTQSSSVHYEKCRTLFKERVLPAFPKTKERFDRYFKQSYGLMRALPLNAYFKRLFFKYSPKPMWDKETDLNPKKLVHLNSDSEVDFTLLGIKPMSLIWKKSPLGIYIQRHGKDFLSELGLRITKDPEGASWSFCIFDPILVSAILSKELNKNVKPEDVEKALHHELGLGEYYVPNELLGYPDMLDGTISQYFLDVSSIGELHGVPHTCNGFTCGGNTPELFVPYLEDWASAAAIVEEIKDLGSTVSCASWELQRPNLSKPLSENNNYKILEQVVIERKSPTQDWVVHNKVGGFVETPLEWLLFRTRR